MKTLALALTLMAVNVSAALFYTIKPCRLVDTRAEAKPLWPDDVSSGIIPDHRARYYRARGSCDIPDGAKTIAVNVTAIGAPAAVSLYDPVVVLGMPETALLLTRRDRPVASSTLLKLSDDVGDGSTTDFAIFPDGADVHVIIDVVGYFR